MSWARSRSCLETLCCEGDWILLRIWEAASKCEYKSDAQAGKSANSSHAQNLSECVRSVHGFLRSDSWLFRGPPGTVSVFWTMIHKPNPEGWAVTSIVPQNVQIFAQRRA